MEKQFVDTDMEGIILIMTTFFLIALPIVFGISGQLCLKAGILQVGNIALLNSNFLVNFIKILSNPLVFSGFVLYAMASVVWIVTLSRVPLSYAYPMLSINYVGVLAGSSLLFGEDVNLYRWIGVVVICVGVVFIGRS